MKHHANMMPLSSGASQQRFKLAPATLAILIQVAALMIVFSSVLAVNVFFNVRFPILVLVMMQSLSALALCMMAGMATWWRWIHACFPLAMFVMTFWAVPNEVYLIGFLITLSIFWTTFRSQVPFFPSRPAIRGHVASLIPDHQSTRMIDIGSGLGDLSMYIANQKRHCQVEGIEIAPMPWFISLCRAKLKRSKAQFSLGNYHDLDFADYDLVFAYLSPAAMPALWQKASQEMPAGSLLVSYEFAVPNQRPSYTLESGSGIPTIYVWQM